MAHDTTGTPLRRPPDVHMLPIHKGHLILPTTSFTRLYTAKDRATCIMVFMGELRRDHRHLSRDQVWRRSHGGGLFASSKALDCNHSDVVFLAKLLCCLHDRSEERRVGKE